MKGDKRWDYHDGTFIVVRFTRHLTGVVVQSTNPLVPVGYFSTTWIRDGWA